MTFISSASRKSSIGALLAAGLLWLLFAQAMRGAVMASITFDEGPHLAAGYAYLKTGDLRLQPIHIHPPLTNILAAAPLLLDPDLADPRAIHGWNIASLSAVTDAIVWQNPAPGRLALAGRTPIILLGVLLGALVYRWAADLAGRKAGLLALFLYALDPNIVAHTQVITTDMGVALFGFAALYACFKASRFRDYRWPLVSGAMLGAALASKVSAALLALLLIALEGLQAASNRSRFTFHVSRLAVTGAVALLVVWAVYGFEIGQAPGSPLPLPAATHVKIYQSLQQHYAEGHPSFLMGMNSTRGWWYYFPVAFLVKTPLPTLILLVASIFLGLGGKWKVEGGRWILGLFPLVHFATALFSSVDIGYRHLLPVLPFIYVFIGSQISNLRLPTFDLRPLISNRRPVTLSPRHLVTLSLFLILPLFAWHIVNAATIFPHNLAYFNELAGGPDNGYNWLVDSNLDWGQNLKELKAYMDAHGISRVFISQFSPSRPEMYGIDAIMLPPSPRANVFARLDPAPGWYAIGATTLQGVYTPDVNTFAYFRAKTPTARIGHALFLYHLEPRQPANWVALCITPTPLLSDEEIITGLGQDVRRVYFDCARSWVYPNGTAPGIYILTPEAVPPPQSTLEAQARRADGAPFYNAYRIESNPAPGQTVNQTPISPIRNTTMAGPLAPIGYWLDRAGAYPGDTVQLWMLWQVKETPSRPLSLMAHLVGPDGRPAAIDDGLGFPIEQWLAGDMLVQRHTFRIPPETRPGNYAIHTGAYWLDTMERWTVNQEGTVGGQLILGGIIVSN